MAVECIVYIVYIFNGLVESSFPYQNLHYGDVLAAVSQRASEPTKSFKQLEKTVPIDSTQRRVIRYPTVNCLVRLRLWKTAKIEKCRGHTQVTSPGCGKRIQWWALCTRTAMVTVSSNGSGLLTRVLLVLCVKIQVMELASLQSAIK